MCSMNETGFPEGASDHFFDFTEGKPREVELKEWVSGVDSCEP